MRWTVIISCCGACKRVVDIAAQTSDTGYHICKLVQVVQHIVIHRTDRGTIQRIFLSRRNGMMSEKILSKY